MTESVINEMKPYAPYKGGHKNMRDVDKWSESRPDSEVRRGIAHVKKKPGKSAVRQAGKKDAAELDEASLEEMKPYGQKRSHDDNWQMGKTSHGHLPGPGGDARASMTPKRKAAARRGDKRLARAAGKKEIRAQVGESFLRRIIREEWARLLEAAGFPHGEFERAMSIAQSKASSGEDPISIGFYLENEGFMPNVVDAVLEAI